MATRLGERSLAHGYLAAPGTVGRGARRIASRRMSSPQDEVSLADRTVGQLIADDSGLTSGASCRITRPRSRADRVHRPRSGLGRGGATRLTGSSSARSCCRRLIALAVGACATGAGERQLARPSSRASSHSSRSRSRACSSSRGSTSSHSGGSRCSASLSPASSSRGARQSGVRRGSNWRAPTLSTPSAPSRRSRSSSSSRSSPLSSSSGGVSATQSRDHRGRARGPFAAAAVLSRFGTPVSRPGKPG